VNNLRLDFNLFPQRKGRLCIYLIKYVTLSRVTNKTIAFDGKQSKRKPAFFWINAMAPLTTVILGSILVYFTHAENHGVQVVSS